jgi:Flp pilus assembly protein CpaB
MTYSVRNIVIALVLAAVAAALVIMYTSNVQQQAQNSQKNVTVVVAKTDIPAGTAISDVISSGMLTQRSVVAGDLVPGAYRSISDLNTSLATGTTIPAGAQVTPTMLSQATNASIRDVIQGTDRAIQVAYNPNRVL